MIFDFFGFFQVAVIAIIPFVVSAIKIQFRDLPEFWGPIITLALGQAAMLLEGLSPENVFLGVILSALATFARQAASKFGRAMGPGKTKSWTPMGTS